MNDYQGVDMTSLPNIPDAAVEAAMFYIWAHDDDRPVTTEVIRAALEAAAPHLMARSWDEGHEEGWLNHESGLTESQGRKRNPYRSMEATK